MPSTPTPSARSHPHPQRLPSALAVHDGAHSRFAVQSVCVPFALLQAFTLRMADNGLCVSASTMMHDPQYAQDQLACAHSLDDAVLRAMAVSLFQQLEASGTVSRGPAQPGLLH